MEKFVIVVGGGSGTRMKSTIPKQFMTLADYPILMHTIQAFANSLTKPTTILVLNKQMIAQWKELCHQYAFTIPHIIVEGGNTRFHSVQNGLHYIEEKFQNTGKVLIAIHDGVRPLVSQKIIDNGFEDVPEKAALVPAVTSKESVRILDGNHSIAVDRNTILLIQTPQFFLGDILFKAYTQPYIGQFTDDASVVEKAGYPIHIMDGDIRNIKITFPEDIDFAELLLKSNGLE